MDKRDMERLIAEAVELMKCGETVSLEKRDDWVEEFHLGGAAILPIKHPGIKPHTFAGHRKFYAPDPLYYAALEAWKIVSPETFEIGRWEFPKPAVIRDLPHFKRYFTGGGFESVVMSKAGNFLAFLTSSRDRPPFAEFEFDSSSEYANYLETKVGKMTPGETVIFEENPIWKYGKDGCGDQFLPRKIQVSDHFEN